MLLLSVGCVSSTYDWLMPGRCLADAWPMTGRQDSTKLRYMYTSSIPIVGQSKGFTLWSGWMGWKVRIIDDSLTLRRQSSVMRVQAASVTWVQERSVRDWLGDVRRAAVEVVLSAAIPALDGAPSTVGWLSQTQTRQEVSPASEVLAADTKLQDTRAAAAATSAAAASDRFLKSQLLGGGLMTGAGSEEAPTGPLALWSSGGGGIQGVEGILKAHQPRQTKIEQLLETRTVKRPRVLEVLRACRAATVHLFGLADEVASLADAGAQGSAPSAELIKVSA